MSAIDRCFALAREASAMNATASDIRVKANKNVLQ
jgi:hypothetical protein